MVKLGVKMTTKIDTLLSDIDALFQRGGPSPSEENVRWFADAVADIVKTRLCAEDRTPSLRMSNLGKPDRRIWYDINEPSTRPLSPADLRKFLFGDILELLLIFLCKEAGHSVTGFQQEVEINGVKGHIDFIVDGVLVDAKSASPYSFTKFENGRLIEDDPFGYVGQLSSYSKALGLPAAWLAINKVDGRIALLNLSQDEVESFDPPARIDHLKKVVVSPDLPPRCFSDVPYGSSGNRALSSDCSWCDHKTKCWADANDGTGLRTFLYSKGPVYLTHVEKEPQVFEEFSVD